jgi:GTP-binding protein EngB required for normal cell division
VPLTLAQEASIAEHRTAVQALLQAVEAVDGVSPVDLSLLRAQVDRLSDGLFLLICLGEWNSGKSSCINAILGGRVVAEGVLPTTAEITVLRYSSDPEPRSPASSSLAPKSTSASHPDGVVVSAHNVDLLKTITLVDSPGTNAIDRRHEALTREYLPLCDLVLFVTSADRPFSESERLFLQSIRAWGKKCVILINKSDLLADSAAKAEVVNFVKTSSRALLGSSPQVFAVSSRQALEAKTSSTGMSGPHWDASGFEAFETFISESLDSEERLRIKLRSVADVTDAVGTTYVEQLSTGKTIIAADRAAVADVSVLIKRCQASVSKGFPAHFARVDNVLLELVERADLFFDSHGMPMANCIY